MLLEMIQYGSLGFAVGILPSFMLWQKVKRFKSLDHPGDLICLVADATRKVFAVHVVDIGKGAGKEIPGLGVLKLNPKRIYYWPAIGVRVAFFYSKHHVCISPEIVATASKLKKMGITSGKGAREKLDRMIAERKLESEQEEEGYRRVDKIGTKPEEANDPEVLEAEELSEFMDFVNDSSPEEVERLTSSLNDAIRAYEEIQGKQPKKKYWWVVILVAALLGILVFGPDLGLW